MSNVEPEQPRDTQGGFLTQKYGPLPAWGWLVVTVIVVFVFLKLKSSSSKSTATGTTGTTDTTGTNTALSSNLVAFQQPVPTLNGTYQVQVTPENAPNSVYAATGNSSTQGVGSSPPPTGTMAPGSIPGNPAVNVLPQTQSSSPQTQGTVG